LRWQLAGIQLPRVIMAAFDDTFAGCVFGGARSP